MSTEAPIKARLSEYFQFTIALIMVVALVVFLGILYYTGEFDHAESVIATFGAFVGVIIGFYFGQKPVQQFARQAIAAEEDKKTFEKALEGNSASLNMLIKKGREKLKEESAELGNKEIDELAKLLGGNE